LAGPLNDHEGLAPRALADLAKSGQTVVLMTNGA
jgi:hypothetical protein